VDGSFVFNSPIGVGASLLVYHRQHSTLTEFDLATGARQRRWTVPEGQGIVQVVSRQYSSTAGKICVRTTHNELYCHVTSTNTPMNSIIALDQPASTHVLDVQIEEPWNGPPVTCVLLESQTVQCNRSGASLSQLNAELAQLPPIRRIWLQYYDGEHQIVAQTLEGSLVKTSVSGTEVIGWADTITSAGLINDDFCFVTTKRSLWCWGQDLPGYKTPSLRAPIVAQPKRVIGVSDAVQIATGWYHTCSALGDESVWCWGSDRNRQRGSRAARYHNDAPSAVQGFTTQGLIKAGGSITCSTNADTELKCWGDSYMLLARPIPDFSWSRLSISLTHACGVDPNGDTWCWSNHLNSHVLGALDPAEHVPGQPVLMDSLGRATDIGTGWWATCIVDELGEVWCWGKGGLLSGEGARLFGASGVSLPAPTLVDDIPLATQVSLTAGCACIIGTDNQVYCWGDGSVLGGSCNVNGSTGKTEPVAGLPSEPPLDIHTGDGFACSLHAGGALYCWGDETNEVINTSRAQRIELPPVRQFDIGDKHVCAVTTEGHSYCWGNNRWNQIGDGGGKPYLKLTQIPLY
jgi:hypothetical protein